MAVTWGWESDIPEKTRFTLIRSVVWYLDRYREDKLETVCWQWPARMSNSFRLEIDDVYSLSGHLDRVATHEGEPWIIDRKTTKYSLDKRWFDGFTPDNQMTLYSIAGQVEFNTPVNGVMIDGAQINKYWTEFSRGYARRSEPRCSRSSSPTSP